MNWFSRRQPKHLKPSHLRSIEGSEGYSFCEATTATGSSSWHIRELGPEGQKLSGGVGTSSLCGHVKPFPEGCGGWDLEIPITEHHLSHSCSKCVEEFRRILEIPVISGG